jgi:alpha-glucosidase
MIELKQMGSDLQIFYKGKLIIQHSRTEPCIEIGTGIGRFSDSHANFTIKDTITSRIGITDFEVLTQREDKLALRSSQGLTVNFSDTGSELLLQLSFDEESLRGEKKDYNRFWLRLAAEANEHIYGGGEQFSRTDLRGCKLPLWVEEQGVGRGRGIITHIANVHSNAGGHWYSTYFPQTSFVSSGGWYLLTDTSRYAVFDFKAKRFHQLHFWEFPEIRIGVEDDFPAATASLNRRLGLQPPLPKWVYDGIWLGVQGGSETIQSKLSHAEEAGVQVGALWVQDWEGKRITPFGKQLMWNWKFSATEYADLPDQIKSLKKRGIRFLGYINPFLAIEGDLYKEASEKGYVVKDSNGNEYMIEVTTFPAALIDLTNPQAREWIKGVIKEQMIGIGLSGWMCDYGEYLPTDAQLFSGEKAEEYHNRYPVEWARVNREAVEEAGMLGELVFFNRSGYNGVSRYALSYWAGDQLVDWSTGDGLATAITAGITIGFSGVGFFHSDLGGFTSVAWIKRSKELFLRWAEYAPFNQIMRSHEGNRPDGCWQFYSDRETLEHLAKMTKVYTALKPYHIHLAELYQSSGLPPIRHPALAYPEDEELHKLKYEYLYGPDLLVAPVFKKGRKMWKVYLPDDRWIHLWSGREFETGYHSIDAPIGAPPVFYRKNSDFASLFREIAHALG